MIASDDYAVSIQEGKFQAKQRSYYDGIKRVIQAIDLQISEERKKIKAKKSSSSKPGTASGGNGSITSFSSGTSSRSGRISRRDKENARQDEIINLLIQLKDRILMTISDGHGKHYDFHSLRCLLNRHIIVYLQKQEVYLVPTKQKWMLVVPTFTQQVMDDLHDIDSDKPKRERTNDEERIINVNNMIYITQYYCKIILSNELIIKKDYKLDYDLYPILLLHVQRQLNAIDEQESVNDSEREKLKSMFIHPQSPELSALPCMLYHGLQLIQIYCMNEYSRCKNHLQHHDLDVGRGFVTVILCCLDFIETLIQQRIGIHPIGVLNKESSNEREREIASEIEIEGGREGEVGSLSLLVRMLVPQAFAAMRAMAELLVACVLNDGQAMKVTAIQKSSRPGSATKNLADFGPLAQMLSGMWHKGYKRLCDFVQNWTKRLAAPMPRGHNLGEEALLQRMFVSLRSQYVLASGDSTCATELMQTAHLFAHCLLKIRDEVTRKADRKASMAMASAAVAGPRGGRRAIAGGVAVGEGDKEDTAMGATISTELTLVHALLSSALALGARCSAAYSVLLGPQGHVFGLVLRDNYFFAVRDCELMAALECATTGFAIGFTDARTVAIFTDARNIIHHRYGSFLLSISLIKCATAAAMYVMKMKESGREVELEHHGASGGGVAGSNKQKDALPNTLVGLVDRLLVMLSMHRHSLSICHKVLLLLRVLFRDCFMTRSDIEEAVGRQLGPLCDPWLTSDDLKKKNDDDDDEEEDFVPDDDGPIGGGETNILFLDHSVASTASMSLGIGEGSHASFHLSQTSDPRALGQNSSLYKSTVSTTHTMSAVHDEGSASGSMPATPQVDSRPQTRGGKNEVPPDVYVKKLRPDLLSKAFFGEALPPIPTTLPELVFFIAENHVQTSEVIEQTLLFIEHISAKSSLIRYQLIETGLQLVISRYLDTQPDSIYITALAEICKEVLEY